MTTSGSASVDARPALVAAALGEQGDRLPVWFMRQAGRSLPEYRRVRKGIDMLDACARPDLVAEITLQPVRRHRVDGAVFYSDIVVPLKAAGIDVEIVPGRGPVIANPVRTRADVDALPEVTPDQLEFITEAAGLVVGELGSGSEAVPLIGFAGAPFTLASYLVEGGPSKDYAATKALMVGEPDTWQALCTKLADASAYFLEAQIAGGAQAVQLFDSWAGSLSLADYRVYAMPHAARVLGRARAAGVPTIHFGVGTGELLSAMGEAGADVVGVDWRIPLDEANRRLGGVYALQGNLDPAVLGAPWEVVADRLRAMILAGASAPGHIVNLGHGVPPTVDPDVLTRVVELVHTEGPALRRRARDQKESQ